MKAVLIEEYGGPEVLHYGDVPDPPLAAGSVLIEVRAAGINRGDLGRRSGEYGREPQSPPLIVGWEVAGVVREVGELVQNIRPGDRVVAIVESGGYAELVAPVAMAVVPIPESLNFEEAAGIPVVFLTAWFGLVRQAALRAGETALIQSGGSGVGMAGIQIAKNRGAKVITTAGSDEKLARARELGADETINYRTTDFADAIRAMTGGRGVDVVLESVGGQTLVKSIELLTPGGRLVSVGNSAQEAAPVDASILLSNDISLFGLYLGSQLLTGGGLEDFRRVVDLCAQGELKVIIDRVLPLKEAAKGHQILIDRANFGKVILKP